MASWNDHLKATGYAVEKCFDGLTARLRARTGRGRRIQILPYIGYGTGEWVSLRGRVLCEQRSPIAQESDIWANVLATYRRLNSREVPHARVRVRCGQESREIVADEEGFFSCELPNGSAAWSSWIDVQYHLVTDNPEDATNAVTASGTALIPSPSSAFGVISDIDDTVMRSYATNLVRLARTVFLQSAQERVAFPGVAELYRALCRPSNEIVNPIFYVSSGPWNLYDLIVDFLELNSIPLGPILLQDYGFDRKTFLYRSHADHKGEQITRILNTYPDLPFILIGDSGQQDPEIYAQALARTPNRIKAIYIRDVSDGQRDAEVKELAERTAEHGGELVVVRDSVEIAKHAAGRGVISEGHAKEVAEQVER